MSARKRRPYQLAIVIPDTHTPHEDREAVASVERYMADEAWDYWICLGDLMDNDAISAFNEGKVRTRVSAPTVLEQFDYTNAFLDRHLRAARAKNPKARLVYLEGNHEERTERYVDRLPELAGLVDVERALRLKQRGVEYVRFWSRGDLFQLGKAYFSHGAYCSTAHAAKHVRDFGSSIFYGHVHDVQAFSIKERSKQQSLIAQSFGCLCKYQQNYLRGRPTNWQHAFGVVWVFPDGHFQHAVVPIFNGRFIGPTNGTVYGGKR